MFSVVLFVLLYMLSFEKNMRPVPCSLHPTRFSPTQCTGMAGIKVSQVACGWRHSLALDAEGRVYTFGWSKYGQLGHGDNM